MSLNKDQVQKVAKLANLPLTSEEEELYASQLSKILDYIEDLNSVDTEGVIPTYNVTPNKNTFREDKSGESLSQDEALQNASNKKDGYFVTKGVFEES